MVCQMMSSNDNISAAVFFLYDDLRFDFNFLTG